ncbi:MAG: type II secretion system protein [Phycisphaerales bacterium]
MSKAARCNRCAFTLIELLIVIAVFILLMAVAVPAFSSMMYSSEASMAENAVRAGLAAGRDAAVRAGPGRDSCVVFLFEGKRMMILPCLRAGTVEDTPLSGGPPGLTVTREVFAPVNGFEPVRLPGGWMVRGYATPGMIDPEWYEDTYPSNAQRAVGNWVFPENDFYDDASGEQTEGQRQSFIVRFEGGTGMLKTDPTPVLVLFPSGSTYFRSGGAAGSPWNLPPYRADQEPDGARLVARVQGAPAAGRGALNLVQRQQLLGDRATDTVLCKAVGQLALSNERRLASAMDLVTPPVRLDPDTACLYQNTTEPMFVGTGNLDTNRLNEWIENRLRDTNNALVESEARVFTIHRYLGSLQEVTGTVNAQGVTQ